MTVLVNVLVNGQERPVASGTCLADVVVDLVPGTARGVAVAVNGAVVPRSAWPVTRLSPGDRVEVLVASQGG